VKYIAIKELPRGTQPGEEFEANEAEGDVLMLVGAAKPVEETPTRRPRYHRRDMAAVEA